MALRAPLGLAAEAPGDAGIARHAVDELDGARAGHTRSQRQRHVLHHQPQRRIRRRALGLPQQPGGRPFPGAGHGPQHLDQLPLGVLRKLLVGLVPVAAQRLGQRRVRVAEHVGVKPRDMDRIGLDEAAIQRIRRLGPQRLGQLGMAGGVHADVQHGPRPAPFGVQRRGPHAQKPARVAGQAPQVRARQPPARRDGADGGGGNGEAARNRQVHADQPLQAFRPPAVGGGLDPRGGGDLDNGKVSGLVHGPAP